MIRPVLASLTIVLAAAAGSAAAEETPVSAPAAALPAITVSTVERAVLRDRVLASGLIGPVERISVQPRIEGQAIEELFVEVGDTVAAGEVLARLSETALTLRKSQLTAQRAGAEAAIAQAEAQLVEAEAAADEAIRVRDRTLALQAQGTASQAAADQAAAAATSAVARVTVARQGRAAAEAQLALAEAQIADVELQLQRTQVTAPVAGEVVERNATVGAIASAAGQPMFVIIRDGLLELRADIAEQDVLRLAPGQTALMRLVGSAEPLPGTVRLVEPTVDPATRLGRVRISIEDTDKVRSGMFAEAEILVDESDSIAVPVSAVGRDGGIESALRVTDGQVARVPVETGIRDGGMVEITSGLDEGDLVVTRAGAFVRDGDRINPVPANGEPVASN
ncbi:efflux RND transporter periplasmic adaptor subunit [Ostreiculturibacter nitratireducens]|uniref:efflux RND transporter periplasmic adaptor subunit n=1 Tax=Ostreiculturibacter nitratireducens TaxID=3075226 RepID=UPI0031B639CA